jgi:molybdopterin synthase sulfur carrier subunit
MIRVVLPGNLRSLAGVGSEVQVEVRGTPTQRAVLDALEERYPALLGTMRDRDTKLRRPMLRFYACSEDLSDESPDAPLPQEVISGKEPYLVVGAMAGGKGLELRKTSVKPAS